MATLSLRYPAIKKLLAAYAMKQRTETRQFLAWFLENYYRLEETERDDCICDGQDDKGIDGVYINEQLGQIHAFQSRLATHRNELGDTELKEFYGSFSQMQTEESVNRVAATTKNKELADLIRDREIGKKVSEGYKVRGVFLTNMKRNKDAISYLSTTHDIILHDEPELQKHYVAIDKTAPIASSISFQTTSNYPCLQCPISQDMNMVIAPLLAKDLVKMDGISSGELFAWNVRQFLKKTTKVNSDIEESILEPDEHKYFRAFHNGITVLCKTLDLSGRTITISGYAVVNGCQSLTVFNENKPSLGDNLRIITKFIHIPPESPLARKITERTNNQNGITYRDLQSNNPIRTRLQTEINTKYTGEFYYRIKRGEHPEWPASQVIENEVAARVLLAYDLREPWTCHQTYKLFDELHGKIFGRSEVTGDRIVTVMEIYEAAIEELAVIDNELFANYGLTKYLLLYLVREALQTSSTGQLLINRPIEFLSEPNGRKRIHVAIGKLAKSIARILNTEINRREKAIASSIADRKAVDPFDFKRDLKSPNTVRALQSTVISQYQVMVDSDFSPSFDALWTQSGKPKAKAKKKK